MNARTSFYVLRCVCLLLPASIFLFSIQADAKTVSIGTGSGSLSVTSMNGLHLAAGDTISIATGTYDGATFTNLNNVTIIPAAGGVIFNGPIAIGNDISVIFDGTVLTGANYPYGFTFSNFSIGYGAFEPASAAWNSPSYGNTQNCIIKGIQVLDTGGPIVDATGNVLTYTGTPATCIYYNLTVDTAMETGASTVYAGTYALNNSYQNITIGTTFRNIVCINDGTGNSTKVRGNSVYQMVCDTWSITGPTLANTGDAGVFGIVGNITLKNIYRNGGWGWLLRVFNCSLGTPSTTSIYNCIDINNVSYGTIDTRVDGADINPSAAIPIVGNDVMIANLTSGNHQNATNYTTVLCLDYGNSDGATPPTTYTTSIINCLAFNNPGNGSSSLYGDGDIDIPKTIVKSNNKDIVGALPAGYVTDTYKFYPTSSSLIGKGMTQAITATDIYGTSRGSSYDIGAVQHDTSAPVVTISSPTNNSSTTSSSVAVGGMTTDNDYVASVTWSNSLGGNGSASVSTSWSGTAVPVSSTTWSISTVPLSIGTNVITVTGHDASGNPGTAVLTVTRTSPSSPPTITNAPSPGTYNTVYNFTYTFTGSPTPTFNVTAGGLPPGLTLSSTGVISGTPTLAGVTYRGTVTANNGVGTPATQNFIIPVAGTFNQWLTSYFGNTVDPAIVGPMATPQNDGVPNQIKYLCDINPTQPVSGSDRSALPDVGIDATTTPGTTYLTLTYRQNTSASGLTINVQTSPDLSAWTTVTPDLTKTLGTDPTTGDPIIEAEVAISSDPKEFIRLNVVAQ